MAEHINSSCSNQGSSSRAGEAHDASGRLPTERYWYEEAAPAEAVRDIRQYAFVDWDGKNMSAIREALRTFGRTDSQIDGMSWADVRAAFAAARIYRSQPAVDHNGRAVYLNAETSSGTVVPVYLPTTQKAGPVVDDGQRPTANGVHPATLAKAILFEQPDISPTELAKRCGVSPSTLYKTTGPWKDVRAILMARPKGNLPTGQRAEDGRLDAWPDEDD